MRRPKMRKHDLTLWVGSTARREDELKILLDGGFPNQATSTLSSVAPYMPMNG